MFCNFVALDEVILVSSNVLRLSRKAGLVSYDVNPAESGTQPQPSYDPQYPLPFLLAIMLSGGRKVYIITGNSSPTLKMNLKQKCTFRISGGTIATFPGKNNRRSNVCKHAYKSCLTPHKITYSVSIREYYMVQRWLLITNAIDTPISKWYELFQISHSNGHHLRL